MPANDREELRAWKALAEASASLPEEDDKPSVIIIFYLFIIISFTRYRNVVLQDLALCLTKACRCLVEVCLEWSTVNHLATHHKGNCSRLWNCLSRAPPEQPPERFCLVINMH